MASINARAREEAEEAEWEAMSEVEAGAEWKDAFAKAAAATERAMAEAVAAADNERLMGEAAREEAEWEAEWGMAEAGAANERLMAEAAQAQAQAHQGTEWEAEFEDMVAHHARYKRLLPWYESTAWMRTQRAEYAAGTMSEERTARLNALPFWKWRTEFDVFWADLTQHHVDHGCMPEKGAGADWLANKQNRYSRSMSEANKKMIAARGGPVAAAIMGGAGPGPGPGPSADQQVGLRPSVPRLRLLRAEIIRFPKPTDDGDVRGRQAWEWETKLRRAAFLYWEKGSMPKEGEEGFKWLERQKRLIRDGEMAVDRMHRVREEGGVVAAAIMNERRDRRDRRDRTKAGRGAQVVSKAKR